MDLYDLFMKIAYCYEDNYGPMEIDQNGTIYCYKLTIYKTHIEYKGKQTDLLPDTYDQLIKFLNVRKV